jgi:hypothetical protein
VADSPPGTLDVTHPERDDGPAFVRRRRITYRTVSLVLGLLMLATIVDVRSDVWGVDSTVREIGLGEDGTLRVEHPEVTRPGLASPFAVEVHRPGGFDAPIELAISRPWIESWDENGMYPTPSSETGDADWVVYEFDPPDGDEFRFFYDARLEPARQSSVDGAVELRQGGTVLGRIELDTRVLP